ncbi:MAG: hypothetical protein JOY88_04520, partial [Pelomonas sp.]|nr:hypothetical protein [Roseateles sp.]
IATVLAIGLEATITAAKATLAAFGKAVIAGTALVALREAAAAFAVVTSRTAAISASKARGARTFVTLRAGTAFAARGVIAVTACRFAAACGRRLGATGRRGLFRLGRLGRRTQNRARRRGLGGRGGFASAGGARLFRGID